MAHQALDTFVADIDGAPIVVQKGQVFASNHPVVKLDAGRGVLFAPLELDEDEPVKRPRGRPPKTAAAARNGDE